MKNRKDNIRLFYNKNNRYIPKDKDSSEKVNKSFYFKKIITTNNLGDAKSDLNISAQNFERAFSNVENILINDNTKKKAIKYVIQIGKNKQIKPITNSRNIYQLLNYQQKNYRTVDKDEKIKDKFNENPLDMDIALLISAYNLVNSISSFSQAVISFNDNLKFFVLLLNCW